MLVDDLVTKGVDEPYRMLTSRAEHRVILRHDNADLRLTPLGRAIGLVDDAAWEAFEERRAALQAARAAAERSRLPASSVAGERFEPGSTLADALRRPRLAYGDVAEHFAPPLLPALGERLAIEIKCEGYVRREELAIEKASRAEGVEIPEGFDYDAIRALSREAREKFAGRRPRTLGMASRISGITPSDVAIVALYVHKQMREAASGRLTLGKTRTRGSMNCSTELRSTRAREGVGAVRKPRSRGEPPLQPDGRKERRGARRAPARQPDGHPVPARTLR